MCYNCHFHAHSGGVRFSTKPCNLPTRDVGTSGFRHIIRFFCLLKTISFVVTKNLSWYTGTEWRRLSTKTLLGHTCICEAKANRQKETCIMIPLPKGKTLEKRAYRRLGDWRRTSTSFYSPCFSGRACASQSVSRTGSNGKEDAAIYHWIGED